MREQSLLLETWNNPQSIKHSVMLSWNPMAVWSTSLLLFFFFSTDRRNLFDLNTCHSVYKSYLQVNTLVSHLNTMQFLVHEINKSINYSIGRNKNPLPFYKSFYIFTKTEKQVTLTNQDRQLLSKSLPPQDSEGTHRDGSRSLISEAELLSINSLFPTTAWNNMHHLRLLLQVLVLGQLSGNL